MSEDAAPSTRQASPASDLVALLIELSIGVHRFAMYPPGHPSLEGVAESLVEHLTEALATRERLAVGVAFRQLVIDGMATDPRHPVLADLARRLHEHQLGAISFERGAGIDEVAGALEALGREAERDGPPLGTRPDDELPRWPHVRLHRVGYEHLRLREGASASAGGEMDRGTQLWLGLAQVSMASKEPLTEVPDATTVARSVAGHRREAAYDQAVVGYLVQLTDELKGERGTGTDQTRQRVSRLVRELDDATLSHLVEFGGNHEQRNQFVLDASQSLSAGSVLKLLRAAASSSGQTISHSMTRLLTKLAVHAEGGGGRVRAQAEGALRENIEALIADWRLEDPNPGTYTLSLDAMARAAPLLRAPSADEGSLAESERLLEMALEIDAWGPIVERALEEMLDEGGSIRLVRMLRTAPSGSGVARRAWARIATLDELERLMHDPHADLASLRGLTIQLGEPAVDPLFDLLSDSDDRSIRRRAFDLLLSLRSDWITERALARLMEPKWYVQRNMLALLLHFRPPLDGIDLTPWAWHEHPRVRREAVALIMTDDATRDEGILMALEDDDERVVRVALPEIAREASDPVLRTLAYQVLLDVSRSEDLRVAAVRAVARSRSPLVEEALVESVTFGRTLLGRPRLAPASPSVVEALRVLAREWRGHERAREVVDLARRSRDPVLRAAVGGDSAQDPIQGSEEAS